MCARDSHAARHAPTQTASARDRHCARDAGRISKAMRGTGCGDHMGAAVLRCCCGGAADPSRPAAVSVRASRGLLPAPAAHTASTRGVRACKGVACGGHTPMKTVASGRGCGAASGGAGGAPAAGHMILAAASDQAAFFLCWPHSATPRSRRQPDSVQQPNLVTCSLANRSPTLENQAATR